MSGGNSFPSDGERPNGSLRIATVYRSRRFYRFFARDMSLIRWLRISEVFAEREYRVDIIINTKAQAVAKPQPIGDQNILTWARHEKILALLYGDNLLPAL
jgi:hypothetical protein